MTYRVQQVEQGWRNGWSFTPLRGKRPYLDGWQRRPRETLEQAMAWAAAGNVGLRTGMISGIAVIDIEAEADTFAVDAPHTLTVRTGGGGWHRYYHCSRPVKNSVGELAPKWDVRGDGGQVVFVGSVHPETQRRYCWDHPIQPIVEFPYHLLPPEPKAHPVQRDRMTAPVRGTLYAQAAMRNLCDRVAATPEGGRNNSLRLAAFDAGSLVWAGWMNLDDAVRMLTHAGMQAGLGEYEATTTATRGVRDGSARPTDLIRQMVAEQARRSVRMLSLAHIHQF